jgi:peptidoglycan hydrolase-like protein with peptidoglycan-binding domain
MRTNRSFTWLAAFVFAFASLAVGAGSGASRVEAASWPIVQQGNRGPNVTAVQHLLTARGFSTTADGVFGSGTRSSVVAFQRSRGLSADGVVGPNTWAKLVVTVQQGSRGAAVRAAQVQLNKYGYGLAVDGIFGGRTRSATVAFQRSRGLSDDGIIGPNTWRALAAGGGGGGGSYALPLPRGAVARSEYDDPHHDYPALDLPAASGTPAYAVKSGSATPLNSSSCGLGMQVAGDDGATYTYCHFSSRAFTSARRVAVGQRLGNTGNTGNSTGPHLHLQIRAGGSLRCPGPMMLAIYDGGPVPSPGSLPTSGCFY